MGKPQASFLSFSCRILYSIARQATQYLYLTYRLGYLPIKILTLSPLYSCPLGQWVFSVFQCRPFLDISRLLSVNVPMNKWLGFTQPLLSQVWQTKRPLGILPLVNSQEILCVDSTLFLNQNFPYPDDFDFFHSQQSSLDLIATFDQNLSIGFSR